MFFYEQLLLTFHSVRPKNLGLRASLVLVTWSRVVMSRVFSAPMVSLVDGLCAARSG